MLLVSMPRSVAYSRLPTERRHPRSHHLDHLSTVQVLRLMHREDLRAVRAVGRCLPHIAHAVELISRALRAGGRLFFIGAGTSGRLGVLEAAECPPTFHTRPSLVQAIIAGGRRAVFRSQEGAEDDRASARTLIRRRISSGDVVVGVAASGVTPFVDEALRVAARRGAHTICVTCHAQTPLPAQLRLTLAVGPEILTGSTRLKAGTAFKLVLNMLTLGVMVRLGKTYGNLMVDVCPTSRKLRSRAIRIIQLLTRRSPRTAARYLRQAHGRAKVAVLMATRDLTYRAAMRRLAEAQGSLRQALNGLRRPA